MFPCQCQKYLASSNNACCKLKNECFKLALKILQIGQKCWEIYSKQKLYTVYGNKEGIKMADLFAYILNGWPLFVHPFSLAYISAKQDFAITFPVLLVPYLSTVSQVIAITFPVLTVPSLSTVSQGFVSNF
ncbi:hypothetical protein CHS0354_010237 [Potamilus streckersoni]|uniref:Uncharacterized protein n=1 Tax=Potamilus streckersoni TaxID=2493646 RepID=A0AAE0RSM5_9BIVA|nr:hypothetical protein CHS0354_010237 [Potamilus streckersoni]